MKSDIKELQIRLVSIDSCPICGKGWFGKNYLKTIDNGLINETDGFWKYRCERCGFLIYLFSPAYQKEHSILEVNYDAKDKKD